MRTLEDILLEFARGTGISYEEARRVHEKAVAGFAQAFQDLGESCRKAGEATDNLAKTLRAFPKSPRPTSHRPNRFYDFKLNR